MKIGIDAWYLARPYSSIGKILVNTLKYWKHVRDIEIILFGMKNRYIEKYKDSYKVIIIPTKNIIKFYWKLNKEAKKEGVDILFFPFDIAPFYTHDYVVMVHDLIYLDFDRNVKNIIFAFLVKNAVRKAKKVITPSYYTKKKILKEYKVDSRKVRVIHLGIDPTFTKIPYEDAKERIIRLNILPQKVVDKGFILHVGRIRPRYKNITTLLKAYIGCKNLINKALVIVSSDKPSRKDAKTINKFKEDIFLIHNVSDEILALLCNLAEFCVFPSLSEGFGMSVIEALGCGKPLIISNIPTFREIVGDAGLFFDPKDIKQLKELMIELSLNKSLRQELAKKAEKKAKMFTWEKFAGKLLKELISTKEGV